MKKHNIVPIALFMATLAFVTSCKKSDTINNGQVIKAPYSLYVTDASGALFNSNDGKTLAPLFASDGYKARSVITIGNNIIWAKPNLYYSTNEGKNFNLANDKLRSVYKVSTTGRKFDLNQSMLFYSTEWKQAYVASTDPSGQNLFGIAYSNGGGAFQTWLPDDYWDSVQITYPHDITVTSFTQLKDGTMVAYDGQHIRTFYRTAFLDRWKEAFPASASTKLPDTLADNAFFSIGHYNNLLIAIDNIGSKGAYYSSDYGQNWYPFSGIPSGTPLTCIQSPFEELCLVGTEGKGLYLLNPTTLTFQANNNGLAGNASVFNIVAKENVYKNDTRTQYVFLATDKGIYVSYDKGNNWVRTIAGSYVNVY